MPTPLTITVYGGAIGEIGGNKILLETGERTWLLDFGMGFATVSREWSALDDWYAVRGTRLLR
jgi:mRNA degradation ribonuclease J1/J2